MPRLIWILVALGVAVILAAVAMVAVTALTLLHVMDRADAHVCGLAAVRRSPATARMLGTPIEQQGLTAGSTSMDNGEDTERITFTVKGPRGTAFVLARGFHSPLASHLVVTIGRNQRSTVVYSGPLDCAELHQKDGATGLTP
ncbi:MAG TPA: cytochrome c oxidase assembly factor Coa1 family protein [Candidatus Baltobacteraceae bacterium]|nr:cytochrome c oxidase assembly factor Coa1 family protein [Candidatus Baltobacteraceae bacterium]